MQDFQVHHFCPPNLKLWVLSSPSASFTDFSNRFGISIVSGLERLFFSVFSFPDMEVTMSASAQSEPANSASSQSSPAPPTPGSLEIFVQCLKKVPDPRSKRGKSHPFSTILAIVLLGLLGNLSTLAEIHRWVKIHLTQLQQFLRFRHKKGKPVVPCDTTLARILAKLSLDDLQNAFAQFLNAILPESPLAAAVDGKTAKQMKDENGDPIHILNVFAQTYKLHLASWSVHGDKTNEPGCLKKHLEELFTMSPCLKLLTGDAMFAQRPLLEAIQEYHRDYLVQVKENQPNVLEQMKMVFEDAPQKEPSDRKVTKKKGPLKFAVCM